MSAHAAIARNERPRTQRSNSGATADRIQLPRGWYRLSVDQRPRDHGAIEADPPYAWQIDVLVALLYAVPEPQDRREQVRAPRGNRNASGFVAQPDGEDLRDGHQQGEHRHASEQARHG